MIEVLLTRWRIQPTHAAAGLFITYIPCFLSRHLRQRHHPIVPRSVPIFHSYVTRRSRPTESYSHVNFTWTKQLFVHTWEGELFWSVCALWKLLPDSQVISFVLQTFQKMPYIHSAGPSALIHFKERQGPFDFQYSTAERKTEVRPVFEHV